MGDEATKIVINTKGCTGDISTELKAVIEYMEAGVASTEYTKKLDPEVNAVKSDEKVRAEYMLMMEAFADHVDLGERKKTIRLIRRRKGSMSVPAMADMFDVPVNDCERVVALLEAHPDWDNERIAEEIDWTD